MQYKKNRQNSCTPYCHVMLFPEMEFCLLCFSLFHRIVEIDLLDGEIFNEPLPVRSSRK